MSSTKHFYDLRRRTAGLLTRSPGNRYVSLATVTLRRRSHVVLVFVADVSLSVRYIGKVQVTERALVPGKQVRLVSV